MSSNDARIDCVDNHLRSKNCLNKHLSKFSLKKLAKWTKTQVNCNILLCHKEAQQLPIHKNRQQEKIKEERKKKRYKSQMFIFKEDFSTPCTIGQVTKCNCPSVCRSVCLSLLQTTDYTNIIFHFAQLLILRHPCSIASLLNFSLPKNCFRNIFPSFFLAQVCDPYAADIQTDGRTFSKI